MALGSGIRGPRSGIRDPEKTEKTIPDSGSRGQKGTGSRILDPDPQYCERGNQQETYKELYAEIVFYVRKDVR